MGFYNQQHRFYCGVDLHSRSMYLCILDQAGNVVFDQNLDASPTAFLKAVAPFRDDLVVACECLFCWYWLADLCHQEGIAFVLGHALYMNAIHGGMAKSDQIDTGKIARLLRGDRLKQDCNELYQLYHRQQTTGRLPVRRAKGTNYADTWIIARGGFRGDRFALRPGPRCSRASERSSGRFETPTDGTRWISWAWEATLTVAALEGPAADPQQMFGAARLRGRRHTNESTASNQERRSRECCQEKTEKSVTVRGARY